MKLLLVLSVDPWTRSVSTVHQYVEAGRRLGHDIFVFGEPNPELPALPFTTDVRGVDLALFVIQVPMDFPDMPHLARLLDGVPRERRLLVDLWGRYNETIRLEHDFNHLEKLDGHLGWEWEQTFEAVSETILQPTTAPLRDNVRPFLFHGFDPGCVVRGYTSAREAAARWRANRPAERPYGIMYVGSNWQRWEQVRHFLEQYAKVRGVVGKTCLVGWDWAERPQWAKDKGIRGIDTDPDFLAELGVETRHGVRFDEVVALLGQARFAPIFHRPLFRHLGLVTVRTFETFYADSLPVLMLPRDFVQATYGEAALTLVPGDDIASHLIDALERPEIYWEAVLQTRSYLSRHHSYAQRLQELSGLLEAQLLSRGRR